MVLSLARNFFIARLLSPEDYGVSATFALTLSTLEVIGDLSFNKLLIQDPDGDDPDLQAVLQSLAVIRGILLGVAIFAAAGPIARMFHVPDAVNAYRWLAAAPIVRGFAHFDIYRMQRNLSFSAELRLLLFAQIAAFIVAVGLAWLFRDYMAVLWAVLTQAAVQGLGAHLLAERRYALQLQGAMMVKALRFGWPLMLNGFVIVLATQGDRLMVGAQLTMTDLAVYSVASLLVGAPSVLLLKVTGTLALPWLASVQGTPTFSERYEIIGDALAALVVFGFLPLTLLGSQLIVFVFGPGYQAPPTLVGWLALGSGLRVLRGSGPVIASLAAGDTKNLMLSNLVRSGGIFAAAIALALNGGMAAVAATMCLGEIAAFCAGTILLGNVVTVSRTIRLRGLIVVLVAFPIALAFETTLPQDALVLRAVLIFAISSAATAAMFSLSPALMRRTISLLDRKRESRS